MDNIQTDIDFAIVLAFNGELSRLVEKLVPVQNGGKIHKMRSKNRMHQEIYIHYPLSPTATEVMEALEWALGPQDQYLAYHVKFLDDNPVRSNPILGRIELNGQVKLLRGEEIPKDYQF